MKNIIDKNDFTQYAVAHLLLTGLSACCNFMIENNHSTL